MRLTLYGGREGTGEFRPMTAAEAIHLPRGGHCWFIANDGSARRIRINGMVKTWKTRPGEFRIPVKYGMYECGQFTHSDLQRLIVRLDG